MQQCTYFILVKFCLYYIFYKKVMAVLERINHNLYIPISNYTLILNFITMYIYITSYTHVSRYYSSILNSFVRGTYTWLWFSKVYLYEYIIIHKLYVYYTIIIVIVIYALLHTLAISYYGCDIIIVTQPYSITCT